MQPSTSREAHENVKPRKSVHHKWIMEALGLAGEPVTAGEIVVYVDRPMFDKTSVSRRMKEMEDAGDVVRGEPRKCTCRWCSSRQHTWSLKLKLEQGALFDASPIKKW